MDSLNELNEFLKKTARADLKIIALNHIFGLTGTDDGCTLILSSSGTLDLLLQLFNETEDKIVAKQICCIFVNISATGNNESLLINEAFVLDVLKKLLEPDNPEADQCCTILSNLSHSKVQAEKIIDIILSDDKELLDKLLNAFTNLKYNTNGCTLHSLGPVFTNLSQTSHFRSYLLSREDCRLQKLLPFTEFEDSKVRRKAVAQVLRNCCFEHASHSWLLSDSIDILPQLLLPLAGPEVYSDEEMDALPVQLQYLPEDKKREPEEETRKLLVEAVHQLCVSKESRCLVRDKNTYLILRDLHKWETNREVLLAIENVIDILIRTEEELGVDNLDQVDVPAEYVSKFEQMDKDFIAE